MLPDELRYQLLRTLERNPEMTQRQIAKELDLSLGKVNYCLKALLDKGWIVAGNFKSSERKMAYAYYLTPQGIEEKATVTVRFLKRKLEEHEEIRRTIEELRSEVSETGQLARRSEG
ncbi:MarR family EPS-associated transcriptional regulator [Saccharospirillum impatiens]|uniref:MarR family EPS-associated transcriptional regulator n=1 Tax=Saccharospirillum impatiens TaxID=169438 RepID=UPI00048A4F36|nr:MarR family EPS-associated transcriptional regulator [Saccharospirillum impatiens]